MDYFRLEQKESAEIRVKEEVLEPDSTICQVEGTDLLQGMDYLSEKRLVSSRVKELLETFLLKREWKPYVFFSMEQQGQEVFWKLEGMECHPKQVWFDKHGAIERMQMKETEVPRIFFAVPEKGKAVVILHLSIVESLLRRGILGLSLVPVNVYLAEEKKREENGGPPTSMEGGVV